MSYQNLEEAIKKDLANWSVIIKPYKVPDHKKAIIQLCNTFLPFLALWVLMYFSLEWSYWITLGLAVLNGFFMARIFIIQHDCGHQSFLKSRIWNNRLGWFCSFFSTLPYQYWARVHNYHHGHSGKLEHRDIGDINFLTVKEYQELNTWGRVKYRFFRNPLIMFILVPVLYFAVSNRYPLVQFKGWKKTTLSQIFNNVLLVLFYFLLGNILGWKSFLMIQLPILFFFSVIAFWFFYVQHQHDYTYMRWTKNWDFLMASIRGASYYKIPKVFQWLTGNINFHHIHHLSSHIPNYNLERCARENPILQKYVTQVNFRESLKYMFNELWDEEAQKMISFREYKRQFVLQH